MANTRSRYDWESIWTDYRAGVMSIRDVAKKHGIDHAYLIRKAKQNNVKRDLSYKIKQATKAKLAETPSHQKSPNEITKAVSKVDEDATVEQQSDALVQIVQTQRGDIKAANNIVRVLASQLQEANAKVGEIEEDIHRETKDDASTKRRSNMLSAVSLPSRSMTAKNLSIAMRNLITLERQAYGLNDADDSPDDDYDLSPTDKKLIGKATKLIARQVVERAIEMKGDE